jgi:hypothetical protein
MNSNEAVGTVLAQHNRLDVAGALLPRAGVYAVANATGTIHEDDRVSLV